MCSQVAEASRGRRAALFFMTSAGGLVRAAGLPRQGRGGLRRRPAGWWGWRRTAAGRPWRPLSWASTWVGPRPTSAAMPASPGAPRHRPGSPACSCARPDAGCRDRGRAGGGSILTFDGMRARAGPGQRRAADPGPATAYGRGGPGHHRHRRQPGAGPSRSGASSFGRVRPERADQLRSTPPPPARAWPTWRGRHGRDREHRGRRRGLPWPSPSSRWPKRVRRISSTGARLRSPRPRAHRLRRRWPGQAACQTAEALGVAETILSAPATAACSAWGASARPRSRPCARPGWRLSLDAVGLARATHPC